MNQSFMKGHSVSIFQRQDTQSHLSQQSLTDNTLICLYLLPLKKKIIQKYTV